MILDLKFMNENEKINAINELVNFILSLPKK